MKLFNEIDTLQQTINALKPFSPEQLDQIKEYFRIGLTYSSNALEGNSLTESETKIILEEGITIGGKRLVEHLEALGHSDAYNFIYSLMKQEIFSVDDIKQLHHLFYFRINEQQAGLYRTQPVIITGSKYPLPKPSQLEELMKQFVQRINNMPLATQSSILPYHLQAQSIQVKHAPVLHPVEFAAIAHKELVFIHPFVDGNGRVSRLFMNLILIKNNYLPIVIPPVLRHDYIRLLEKAHVDDRQFIEFIAQCLKETQKDFLRLFN